MHYTGKHGSIHYRTRDCTPACADAHYRAATSTRYPAELVTYEGTGGVQLAVVRFTRGQRTRSQRVLKALSLYVPVFVTMLAAVQLNSWWVTGIMGAIVAGVILDGIFIVRSTADVGRPADVTASAVYMVAPPADEPSR